MSENKKLKINTEEEVSQIETKTEEMHLDDARRVKVLSPGMLVFKRFTRNKLAVIGFAILLVMFVFSIFGSMLSPYGQAQVFTGMGSLPKEYASATYNTELRYTIAENEEFGDAARAQLFLALGNNEESFIYNDTQYSIVNEGENFYRVIRLEPVAEELLGSIYPIGDFYLSDQLSTVYQSALDDGSNSFEFENVIYTISKEKKTSTLNVSNDIALGMIDIYDAYNEFDIETINSFSFKLASSIALINNEDNFSVGDQNYSIVKDEAQITILDEVGSKFAEVSDIIVNPLDNTVFLNVDFKAAIRKSIYAREEKFTYTHTDGETVEYTIDLVNTIYNIKKETPTELISILKLPSAEHPLGLDGNGMDVMTRLMYGGRVSLLVGFVVIFMSVSIGVIVGGISGYFGGWVDTLLMRFIDLFNSIPFWPIVLILGSVMDTLELEPMVRIYTLMFVLGLLSWPGPARTVRGQILSLREQEFMVATEATGIRTSRRIFKHLVPNVAPLLIVNATAGLGSVIITEATLGFLGLGVKYPLASWGSIINAASDAYIMTNFWNMWIPAGLLILLTVLGFNFVGDGLRDAYDPKMKR